MDQIKRRHAAVLKHVQASTLALNRVDRFTHLDKGFSPDVKFIGWEHDTLRFLIRFADIDRQEILQAEFEILAIGRNAHIPCPDPIRFGITVDEKTCYSIVSYILGEGADRVLPTLSVDRQFQLGVDTGRILRKTHHISPAHEAIHRNVVAAHLNWPNIVELWHRKIKEIVETHDFISGEPPTWFSEDIELIQELP